MLLFVTSLYIYVCHGGKEDECTLLLPATAALFTETQVREPAATSPSAHLSLRYPLCSFCSKVTMFHFIYLHVRPFFFILTAFT